jgi:hypothetical protein
LKNILTENGMENSEDTTEKNIIREAPSLGLIETETPHKRRWGRIIATIILTITIYLGFIPFLLLVTPKISEFFVPVYKADSRASGDENKIKTLKTDIKTLEKKIDKLIPGNVYLVINTTENHFSLYKNRKISLEGICSTGSYISLEGDNKKWVFKTPRGDFKVLGKLTKPVWRKPDWAFVEEGLPIPSANHPSRFEKGVLGDYALAIGNGYMIHGTLYQRFLGMPVTHGCIRMSDSDLKVVYDTLPVGSKVFIY